MFSRQADRGAMSISRGVFLLLALAACSSQSRGGEQAIVEGQAIINGSTPAAGDPLAAIVVSVNGGGCSGTLVTNRWVLTAAHCVGPTGPANGTVADWAGAQASFDSIQRNPDGNSGASAVDAALLHLASPLGPSGLRTPLSFDDVYVGETLNCYGYGWYTLSGAGSGPLRQASLTVSSLSSGGDSRRYEMTPNAQGQSQAPADSGGPCFLGGTIVGVQSSWGYNSLPDGGISSVNNTTQTKASVFHDWAAALTGWSAVYRIGGDANTFPAGTRISAVSRRDGTQDIFALGTNGYIYWNSYSESAGWSGFNAIGGHTFPPGHEVTAVSRAAGAIDLFAIDANGAVYSNWFIESTSSWGGWFQIGAGTVPGSKVAAVGHTNPEGLDAFVIGNDHHLYTAFYRVGQNNNGWLGWYEIDSPSDYFDFNAKISVVHQSAARMDLVLQGQDGRADYTWWQDGYSTSWAPIYPLGYAPVPGNPGNSFDAGTEFSLISRATGRLDLFAVGSSTDRRIIGSYFVNPNWSAFYAVGTASVNTFPALSRLGALGRSDTRMDLFAVGNNGLLTSATWDGVDNQWTLFQIGESNNVFPTGNPVTALMRGYHLPGTSTYLANQQIDIFAVGYPMPGYSQGGVWAAYWHP